MTRKLFEGKRTQDTCHLATTKEIGSALLKYSKKVTKKSRATGIELTQKERAQVREHYRPKSCAHHSVELLQIQFLKEYERKLLAEIKIIKTFYQNPDLKKHLSVLTFNKLIPYSNLVR